MMALRFAAIGRQRPVDHLPDIVVDRAAFAHGGDDRGEIVVGQHQLGGLLGGLGALAAHRHADIGALQRRRIVDAVAGHRRHRAIRLQRLHQAQLVLGLVRANTVTSRATSSGSASSSRSMRLPGDDLGIGGELELAGDRRRRGGMIAGDHLHARCRPAAFAHRRRSPLRAADRSVRAGRAASAPCSTSAKLRSRWPFGHRP